MHIESALADATKRLTPISASPRLDATLLLAHILGISREQLLINADRLLNNNEIKAFETSVERRQQSEPIAYIIGIKEFWSLDFCVTPDTLIPRPDSETLVEAAVKLAVKKPMPPERAKPITILDIGTGSGCLLIALLKELPGAQGVGVDKSERALRVAEQNAKRLGVANRARWIKSHWCDAIEGTFDLILSNPPYITEPAWLTLMDDVARFEPRDALVAGGDGLDAYRALAPQVAQKLNAGGTCLFEIGMGQERDVEALLSAAGLSVQPAAKDLAGITRCIIAQKAGATKTN